MSGYADNEAHPSLQAVGQLLQLGAHFALAERAAKIGYWRLELATSKFHWSPGLFALLGLDQETASPSSEFLLAHMPADDREMVMRAVRRAVRDGTAFQYRTRTVDIGPAERVFETHGDVERDAEGKVVAVLGVVREVTVEVHALHKLELSEAAYRFMTEQATDIIIRHGHGGEPLFISPAIERIIGYTPEERQNKPPFDLWHPDDMAKTKAILVEGRKSGQPVTYVHRARHKLGHYVWLESRVRFVPDPITGELDNAISVTSDVTERVKFEEELLRARERAEAASHTKSRFLANMSHELRTPLNAVIGFSDIIVKEMFGPIGNSRYAEYIKLIHDSGGLLLDLINDLLDMSKIEAGKYELHHTDFTVLETAQSTLQLFQSKADDKQLTLTWNVKSNPAAVRADQRVFKQILLNLVSNAIKFTDPGGKVHAEITSDDQCLIVQVRDTGIGIAADMLPRLAKPFEQVSTEPTRAHGGSGLGLALVKSLSEMHGGQLVIKSTLGHGSTITVTLKLQNAKADTAA